MNKVRLGFISFTEITDPREHHAYNEWHQLDHMPEQFPLDGIAYGQRWVSTPACRAARAASGPLLDSIHYVTLYLMTEPIDRTLREFRALGKDGYAGALSLETHWRLKGGTAEESSRQSMAGMKDLLRQAGQATNSI